MVRMVSVRVVFERVVSERVEWSWRGGLRKGGPCRGDLSCRVIEHLFSMKVAMECLVFVHKEKEDRNVCKHTCNVHSQTLSNI